MVITNKFNKKSLGLSVSWHALHKNFLIVRTYLINYIYIYIYIIEFEKWVQETKRPKDQKVFHLVNES